jgi:hypothetical protein
MGVVPKFVIVPRSRRKSLSAVPDGLAKFMGVEFRSYCVGSISPLAMGSDPKKR